jgi:hypothetical protein
MNPYNLENNPNLSEYPSNSEQNGSTWLQEYQKTIEQNLARAIEQVDKLLVAGNDCQIAGLLPETAISIQSEQKNNGKCRAYIDLIHALLHCPEGLETEVIAFNRDLIDSGLVRIMEQMATNIAAQGDRETANFLESCVREIKQQSIDAEISNLKSDNWIFG